MHGGHVFSLFSISVDLTAKQFLELQSLDILKSQLKMQLLPVTAWLSP